MLIRPKFHILINISNSSDNQRYVSFQRSSMTCSQIPTEYSIFSDAGDTLSREKMLYNLKTWQARSPISRPMMTLSKIRRIKTKRSTRATSGHTVRSHNLSHSGEITDPLGQAIGHITFRYN